MRRHSITFLFVVALLYAPFSAAASTLRPPLIPDRCPSPSYAEATAVQTMLMDANTKPAAAKTFLQNAIYCPNACYDLQTTLTLTYTGLRVDVKPTNKCSSNAQAPDDSAQNPRRGCSQGLSQPQITISTRDVYSTTMGFKINDQDITKSRCDATAIEAATSNFFDGLKQVISNPQGAQAQMQSALDQFSASTPTVSQNAMSPAAIQAAQDALKSGNLGEGLSALGANQNQIKSIVTGDSLDAQKLLQDIAAGNAQAAKQDAAKLNLNPDLSGDVLALNATESVRNGTGAIVGTPQQIDTGASTFTGDTPASSQTKLSDSLAPLCDNLGGCGDMCAQNAGSLTCRTNNPGALTWSPWEAKYGGSPCGQTNNTACFPSIDQGLAAKIDLLTGSRYFGGANNTILSTICTGYSTNAAGNECVAYATFVQNQTQIPMNQTVDPRNAQQIGAIAMAMSRYENGRSVPYTPDQLQNALSLVYGGSLPSRTSGFTPQFVPGTNNPNIALTSPFGFLDTSAQPVTTMGYTSPFSNLFSSISGLFNQSASYASSSSPQNPIIQSPSVNSTQTRAQVSSTSLSASTIIAQPSSLGISRATIVSWSSVGMSACVVTIGGVQVAQGNFGSKSITITQMGTTTIALTCTNTAGSPVQQTATVVAH